MSDELFLQARETDTGRTLQILSHVAKLEAANDKLRKALVAWFVRHKRPDGTEPRPVAPDQQYLDGQN